MQKERNGLNRVVTTLVAGPVLSHFLVHGLVLRLVDFVENVLINVFAEAAIK